MAETPGSAHEFDLDDLAGTPALEHALFGGDAPPGIDLAPEPEVTPEKLPRKLGLPLGRPTRAERRRQAARGQGAASADDDPFATLLAPLDDDELDQLRAEIERDEVLFVRHQRARLLGERLHRLGVLVAIAVALLMALGGIWTQYIDAVNAQLPPTWISDWAGGWAGGIWLALALYGAIMWLVLLGATVRALGRTLARPSLTAAVVVIAQIILTLLVVALLLGHQVLATLALATAGVILAGLAARWAFGSLTRRRR